MAGIIREHASDTPPKRFPDEFGSGDPPTFITHPYRTTQELLQEMSKHRLILTPNTLPSYSNTGFSLLGAALLAAAQQVEGRHAPKSYASLIERDIFDRLDLTSSSFRADGSNKKQVIPSVKTHETVST